MPIATAACSFSSRTADSSIDRSSIISAADLFDGVGDGARRDLHFGGLPDLLAEERLAERRVVGDAALQRVRLGGADDGEGLLFAAARDLHAAADADGVGAAGLDHDGAVHGVLELHDAALGPAGLVLGVMVIGVLLEVAHVLGFFDTRGHLTTFDRLEVVQFRLQFFQSVFGDVDRFAHILRKSKYAASVALALTITYERKKVQSSENSAFSVPGSLFLRKISPVDLFRDRRRGARAFHAFLDHHRSEEHTSELQSLAYLVCRLLLEKKKKKKTIK